MSQEEAKFNGMPGDGLSLPRPLIPSFRDTRFFWFPITKPARVFLRWMLFLYVAAVLCPIQYCSPSGDTVDNSWLFGLNYAAATHLVIGRDVIWTWGPLSYLLFPFDIGNNLAQGLLFQIVLWLLTIVVMWDLFFRGDFSLRNLALCAILIGLSTVWVSNNVFFNSGFLYPSLILLVHYRLRGGRVRYLAALATMGVIPLIQTFGASIVVGVVAGLVIELLLREDHRARLDLVLAVSVPAAVATACCVIVMGSFHNVVRYISLSLELTRGYSIAMSTSGPRLGMVAAFEGIFLLIAALFLLKLHNREQARFFSLIWAAPMLMDLKHGFLRQDSPHVGEFFCFLAVPLALVMLAVRLDRQFTGVAVAVVVLLFAVLWQDHAAGENLYGAIASVTGISPASRALKVWHFERLRRSLDANARANFPVDARIEPEIKLIVGHERVGFLSDIYSNALMDDLNLVLFPVLQRYSAYTPNLDRLDATWIDNHGPRFLIFSGSTIDGRHPWTESPSSWTEVYRWYETRFLGKNHLLLQRRPQPRFGQLKLIVRRTIGFGEELAMPDSQEPIAFWSMQCHLTEIGKLKALLARIPPVMMDVNGNSHIRTFRVLPPVLGGPSLANYLPSSLAEFAEVFGDRENWHFLVTSLNFRSLGKSAYRHNCEIEFLSAQN